MARLTARIPALAAMALPVVCGAAWMLHAGAPSHYAIINLAALSVGLLWIAFGRAPAAKRQARIAAGVLVAVLFVPLLTGPHLNSSAGVAVSRWIPLGPLALHAGMLASPPLAVLAARERSLAAPILLAATLAALLQPDAGTGFALTIAAVGLHHVTRDWRIGVTAIIGFIASLVMVLRGKILPQPFVERVVVDAFAAQPWFGAILALSLLGSFLLMLFYVPLERQGRYALAGCLFGFAIIAAMAAYPSVLIGFGAAPILGFALALGMIRKESP